MERRSPPTAFVASTGARSGVAGCSSGVVSMSNRSFGVQSSGGAQRDQGGQLIWLGSLVSSADTDAEDRSRPARSASNRLNWAPGYTSRCVAAIRASIQGRSEGALPGLRQGPEPTGLCRLCSRRCTQCGVGPCAGRCSLPGLPTPVRGRGRQGTVPAVRQTGCPAHRHRLVRPVFQALAAEGPTTNLPGLRSAPATLRARDVLRCWQADPDRPLVRGEPDRPAGGTTTVAQRVHRRSRRPEQHGQGRRDDQHSGRAACGVDPDLHPHLPPRWSATPTVNLWVSPRLVLVRLHILLSQAGHSHGGSWYVLRSELDAVGGA
jgi:hypothetical protein